MKTVERKLLVGMQTDKKETRRATTYFQYMKIGSADARVSNSDSNIVRSRIRHIRFPQRKSVILHVEAEEFHLLVMHGWQLTQHLCPTFIYLFCHVFMFIYWCRVPMLNRQIRCGAQWLRSRGRRTATQKRHKIRKRIGCWKISEFRISFWTDD